MIYDINCFLLQSTVLHFCLTAGDGNCQAMVAAYILEFPWWRHQMEPFSALLAICAGNGEFPHKGQWRRALMFSLICTRINGWVNNREAGDLRRNRAHYDDTVTTWHCLLKPSYHILYDIISCMITTGAAGNHRLLYRVRKYCSTKKQK